MHPLGAELGAFRPSPRVLLPICVLPAIATAPMAIRKVLFSGDVSLVAAGVALLAMPASVGLMYLLLLPLLSLFTVRVRELGIQGHDAYGRRVAVAWPHVQSAREVSLVGLTYLRVAASSPGRTLWLPRFLRDQPAFDRLVAERAGSAHPLTQSLR